MDFVDEAGQVTKGRVGMASERSGEERRGECKTRAMKNSTVRGSLGKETKDELKIQRKKR